MSHDVYRERILLEISELEALQTAYQPLVSVARSRQPDLIETAALAQVLHSFYNGVERLFVLIVKATNRNLPSGFAWHRSLLELISKPGGERAAVISAATRESLIEYLGFRHVVRHTYSRHLDSDRIKALAENLEEVWPNLRAEVLRFLDSEMTSSG